jgi:predicted secreted protein
MLLFCAALPAIAQQPPTVPAPAAPALPANVYRAAGVKDALAALGATGATASGRLLLEVPDIHDTKQPVPVRMRSELPNTDAMVLLVERRVQPIAVAIAMRPMSNPDVVFQVPIDKSSPVRLLVRADGRWYSVTRTVRLATEAWK